MKNWLIILIAASLVAGCKKPAEPTAEKSAAEAPRGVSVQDVNAPAAPPPPTATADAAPAAEGAPVPVPAGDGETVDLSALRTALASYMQKTGKTPEDLNDLVKGGFVRSLPVAPNGYRLFYDPITVTVNVVKKW